MRSTLSQYSRRRFLSDLAATLWLLEHPLRAMTKSVQRRRAVQLVVLDAPSNLGLKPPSPGNEPGVRAMAGALKAHGVVKQLHAEDAGVVVPPAYSPAIDPAVKVRNATAIRDYSLQLAGRIEELIGQGKFPLVLGGDCSILLGSALGLRRRGRYGLLFVDGHADLLTPENSQSKGAAGMDLALATGLGPALLTDIDSKKPYIRPEDAIVFGYRQPPPGDTSPVAPQPPMGAFPFHSIEQHGIAESARSAVKQLESGPTLGFWVHVDMDVLNTESMPAVDSPETGGMTPQELTTLLKVAVHSDRCAGMEITIYDPTLDPVGKGAALIVDMLAEVFSRERREA